MVEIVSVTKKGQFTTPKRLIEKYGIKDKVIFEENECGLVMKPVPTPDESMELLKPFFQGKTARQLLEEGRKEEYAKNRARFTASNT